MASHSDWFVSPLLLLLLGGCAGGGGGGGGGGGPVDPPTGPTAFTQQAGLACVAPGPGALRIDFTRSPDAGFEVAAFVSPDRNTLFSGAPRVPAPGAARVTVSGLTDGTQYFIGLGIRPTGGGTYQQIGPSLTATPGAPIYVDAASSAANPDGLTPATAFRDMFTAVLTAFAALNVDPTKSVNVWVKGGTYVITSTLPVTAGVNIYGGFGPGFDLASRDLASTPTLWRVASGQQGMAYGDQLNTSLSVIVDGIRITGNNVGRIAIDTDSTDPCQLELRCVIVTDMADRGMRLRNATGNGFDVLMTSCQSSRNGADGVNGSGAFDYSIYNCVFASNVQEGFDLNDLSVESGGVARLNLNSTQFFGNGAEGLDCTLGLPLTPTTGDYQVRVRGCAFERNAAAGCLIDADFELAAGYSADIQLRESIARGNSGHGFHLDLDAPLDTNENLTSFVYSVLATSNALDGLYLTSESRPGLVTISTSAMVGNIGAGLRLEGPVGNPGNVAGALTHCVLASNFGGGLISRDLPVGVASSVAYMQSSAFDANAVQVGNVSSSDPATMGFLSAPEEYARVTARSGAVLTLSALPGFSNAASLELADDGTERAVASIAGAQVTLTAAPDDFGVPGLLSAFVPGSVDVNEDYGLAGGSIALGAGLNGADAGPLGSAAPSQPGQTAPVPAELFYVAEAAPALAATVGANQSLVLTFSKTLNGASANASSVRAKRGANTLGITLQTSGAQLTILAPGGGWGAGDFRVELDGLRASDGTDLSGALVLPFQR